jgi:hypothetical protein
VVPLLSHLFSITLILDHYHCMRENQRTDLPSTMHIKLSDLEYREKERAGDLENGVPETIFRQIETCPVP